MAHTTTASDVVLFLKQEVAECKDLLLELKLALAEAHVDENSQSAVFEEIQLFARRCMSAMKEQCDASLQHWRNPNDGDSDSSTPRANKIVLPSPLISKQKHSPRRSMHSPRHSRPKYSSSSPRSSPNGIRSASLDAANSLPEERRVKIVGDSDSDDETSGGFGGSAKKVRPVPIATSLSGRTRYNTMASTPRSANRSGSSVQKEIVVPRDGIADGLTKSLSTSSESLLHIKVNEKGRISGKEFRPRASSVGRSAQEIVSQKGPRGIYPPILAMGTFPSLRIDLLVDEPGALELDMRDDLYQFYFFLHEHVNFIVAENENEHYVVSVLSSPTSPDAYLHRALKTTKKGYHEFDVHVASGSTPFAERAEIALQQTEGKSMWQPTSHFDFCRAFASLEVKHSQKRSGMKIGVICVRPNQTELKQMFLNGLENYEPCSDSFWRWMKTMGHEIDLKNWHGYRGDMGHEGRTYFEEWRGVSTMYHLAPLMDSEGHRRLIGNDVNVLFFLDGDVQFDPSWSSQLGTVPQIFGVVKPDGDNYRLAFFNNVNIKPYGPEAGLNAVDSAVMKETVLTKMYNGLVMTTYCPPLNRLFFLPRGQTLENIVAQYMPADAKKYKAKKDKSSERSNRRSTLLPFSKKPRNSVDLSSKSTGAEDNSSDGQ